LRSRRIISLSIATIFGVHLWLVKGDALPVGNLGPDHDAIAIGGALHALVVRVVRQANEVGVHFLQVAEDCIGIFLRVGAAAADRRFRVHVGALKKDCLAVEENARAIDPDIAEANIVGELVLAGGEVTL
jgi:hypothetical protein